MFTMFQDVYKTLLGNDYTKSDFGSGILESLKLNLTWCVMSTVCWLVQISTHMWQSCMCAFFSH